MATKENKDTDIEIVYMPLYKSTYESMKKMTSEQVRELIMALGDYYFYDQQVTEPSDLVVDCIFRGDKPNLDRTKKRFIASATNGKLGGAPKGNMNSRKRPLAHNELMEFNDIHDYIMENRGQFKSEEEERRYEELRKMLEKYGYFDKDGIYHEP